MDIDINKFGFGVNVLGSFQSEKGLGTAVRSDIYSLKAAEIPFVCNNSADSGSVNNDGTFDFSNENPYIFNLIHINPHTFVRLGELNINFFEYLANHTNYLPGHYNIGYWVWELDRIPEGWVNISGYLDEVWTPSDFSFQALSKDLPVPVIKMPHCISIAENPFKAVLKRDDLNIPDDVCLFLFIFDAGSYIERKNPFAVIEAFKKAFLPDEKAMLFIKTAHTNFNKAKFYELLNMIKGYNITVSDSVLTSEQLYSLISLSDCYVSLHRSEGFGLTMAEAMSLGKPVIATGYSGSRDFMNRENSYPVDYRLVKIDNDYGVYTKGNFWAEPDINEAAKLMRDVFDNRDKSIFIGAKGKDYIKKHFSPEAAGEMYKKRLNNIICEYDNKIS
jgi:glycosyltransferase involved in cell wall biosynthesis